MATLQLIEEFLNTVDERTFSRHGESHVAGEHLTSPAALGEWLAAHELPGAGAEPEAADLVATVALRTALRQVLLGEADSATALAGYQLHLVADASGGLRISAGSGRPWLDVILETVARSAARGDWPRLKLCVAPDCHWAFHDTSRSGRGRWCSMEVCGNRHKTRTYRERHRQAG
ncbi:CGNR zinc finger domain-containing protein [Actinoplanes sp. NPDC004185]